MKNSWLKTHSDKPILSKRRRHWNNGAVHRHTFICRALTRAVKILHCFCVLLNPSLVLSTGVEAISALLILLLEEQPHMCVFSIFRLDHCNLDYVMYSPGNTPSPSNPEKQKRAYHTDVLFRLLWTKDYN